MLEMFVCSSFKKWSKFFGIVEKPQKTEKIRPVTHDLSPANRDPQTVTSDLRIRPAGSNQAADVVYKNSKGDGRERLQEVKLSSPLMYRSNRSLDMPPSPGIPRAFDVFSCPGGRGI